MTAETALPRGTELVGAYRIESVLGAGGFGITYRAIEMESNVDVAVKEYFPSDYAMREATVRVVSRSQEAQPTYKWGLKRFLEEAQTLARFKHPNIVRVSRVFRDNNTAYMVLTYEEGRNFGAWLNQLGRPPTQEEMDRMVAPLLDALDILHLNGYLHRDIAPDNLYLRSDGTPVLLDFGAARQAIGERSKDISALVKIGYSPPEQFVTRAEAQGPWSDIYALGATLYRAVAGEAPPEATERMIEDRCVPATQAAAGDYRPGFLSAIDHALKPNPSDRPQTARRWARELFADAGRAHTNGPATRRAEVAGETEPSGISRSRGARATRRADAEAADASRHAQERREIPVVSAGEREEPPPFLPRRPWLRSALLPAAALIALAIAAHNAVAGLANAVAVLLPAWLALLSLSHNVRYWLMARDRRPEAAPAMASVNARDMAAVYAALGGALAIALATGRNLPAGLGAAALVFLGIAGGLLLLSVMLRRGRNAPAMAVLGGIAAVQAIAFPVWTAALVYLFAPQFYDAIVEAAPAINRSLFNIAWQSPLFARYFWIAALLALASQGVLTLIGGWLGRRRAG